MNRRSFLRFLGLASLAPAALVRAAEKSAPKHKHCWIDEWDDVPQVDGRMYADVRALMKGRIDEFVGFNFVRTKLM
jgi:hypothetical protein